MNYDHLTQLLRDALNILGPIQIRLDQAPVMNQALQAIAQVHNALNEAKDVVTKNAFEMNLNQLNSKANGNDMERHDQSN